MNLKPEADLGGLQSSPVEFFCSPEIPEFDFQVSA